MNEVKTEAIIPVRGGSKRLPRKNVKMFWDLCPRADWMLLNIGRMGYNNNKTLRILIYRILTEIKVKDNKTVFELASPRMQDYIFKLNSFIKGDTCYVCSVRNGPSVSTTVSCTWLLLDHCLGFDSARRSLILGVS